MIDEKNTILMTKLAIFEKKEKNKSLVISKFFKSDYVRYNVLKTLVAATVLYWTVVGGYVFMAFDVLLAKLNDLDYFGIMYKLLGGYVIVCAIYFLFASFVYRYRYEKAKPGLFEYNVNLKKLIGIDNETQKGHVVTRDTVSQVDMDKNSVSMNNMNGFKTDNDQNKVRVRRSDMIQRQLDLEQAKKNEEILANVQRRNERISVQKEAELRRQRQVDEERRRIRENRQRLEREQMEKIRQQRMQQGGVSRENHMYQTDAQKDMGRSDN